MNRSLVELRFGQLVLDIEYDVIGEILSVAYYKKEETLILIQGNYGNDIFFRWVPISKVRYLAD